MLEIAVDADATELHLAVLSKSNIIRDLVIPLSIPDGSSEYPKLTYANVVMSVNTFKKLCNDISKSDRPIKIESQTDAIRLQVGDQRSTHGTWVNDAPVYTCMVKSDIFAKATKINIGNTRNTNSGIYVHPDHPVLFRTKLGICDFLVYSRTIKQQIPDSHT